MKYDIKPFEKMEDELCEYCECTEFGSCKVNTGPYNFCEGAWCDKAYDNYLDTVGHTEKEIKIAVKVKLLNLEEIENVNKNEF